MGKIRILDPQTVNEIAAGEVIERPASVVKELVENSIDAGACRIQVRIEQGGIKRIEVIDDGEGMSRDDVLLAVRQHATSKLEKITDLGSLSTYGFRGEALASIASVSHLTIRTRRKEDTAGTKLESDFGAEPKISSIGAPPGTSVVVEELFANVPARLKSLSSQKAEIAHVQDVVIRYALARPDITFDLESDGAELLSFRGPDRTSRIAELIGPKAARRVVEFSKSINHEIEIAGALTKIDVTRSSPTSIYLYVNRRPVSSPLLMSAIMDAYGTKLMKGQYPIGYLMVEISPKEIDVNVHPTKREVRFADPERVKESVVHAIEEAFRDVDMTPKLGDLMEYMKVGEIPEAMRPSAGIPSMQSELEVGEEKGVVSAPLVPLFQLFDTYIVARGTGDSVVIIDQHAAAERITYEKILDSQKHVERISQRLLSPVILELTAAERAVLVENLEDFKSLGFDIEEFGGGSYRLVAVPVVLGAEQGERALRLALDDLSKVSRKRPLGEDLIWKVACHGSIRANEPLSKHQMSALISDLFKTSNPYTCEHGRPTMISLSRNDFEKLFKRQI
ncbi:MAG: DNA mismatch repair endonuclease MutL [Thermoplasmata archaeon]